MIIKNLAYQSVLAGYSVLFRTASEILDDLQSEAPELQRRKLKKYARAQVLYLDEVGCLTYDSEAADLLHEIVNRRYECRSLVLTSNKAFKEWNSVFPQSGCLIALLDRLTHHADVTVMEGQSYRVRESEQEAAPVARKQDEHSRPASRSYPDPLGGLSRTSPYAHSSTPAGSATRRSLL